jgi:catechol 2,3-dioxygenase-like lactoylglutathione lyase family enzyme
VAIGASTIFHVNANCSELARSLAFYRDLVGLTPSTHTAPGAQPGAAFDLETARWDAWILTGARGFDGVALDLLEWKVPRPTGRAFEHPVHLGLARLGFTTRDLDARYARLRAGGADCFGPPHDVEVDGAVVARAFVAADPDGVLIEFTAGDVDELAFVVVHCSDLDRSVRFYRDVVGLPVRYRLAPQRQDGAPLRIAGTVEWESAVLGDPSGRTAFTVMLVAWTEPRELDPPARDANQLGLYRLAMLTDNIDRDYHELRSHGARCVSPPAQLDMGPGLPSLRALLFHDPDGTALELIASPSP